MSVGLKLPPRVPFVPDVTTFAQVLDGVLQEQAEAPAARASTAGPTVPDLQRWLEALPGAGPRTHRPAWAVELDVDLPCDRGALKRAFRRRALETHPDRPGGSHEAFLRSMRALDAGLREAH